MGTKNNPGQFDCYGNAHPDEQMFILLGRDKMGGSLTRLWAEAREAIVEDPAKVAEARACASQMDAQCRAAGKEPVDVLDLVPFETLASALRRRGATVFAVPHGGEGEQLWHRDDAASSDVLLLVGIDAPPEVIATWTDDQVRQADEWAACTHLHASDNDDVKVPKRPDFLPQPWTGPMKGDGIWATNPTPVQPSAQA